MKARLLLSLSLCLSFLFTNSLNATTTSHDPVGSYDFVVSDIPDQPDVKGTMTVSKNNGAVKVSFASEAGEMELADAKLDGHKLTGKLEVEGVVLNLSGKFTNDGFEGQWNTEFGALGMSATKK